MGTYRGNVGNLMQHWTLCELLKVAESHTSELSFVDAHAMAPLACARTETDLVFADGVFKRVQERLPGQRSVYEQAWHRLAQGGTCYPNSAAFVKKVWGGDLTLLLCEIDHSTADEIEPWLDGSPELFRGDWRDRFKMGLPDAPLALVSFDPNTYNKRQSPRRPKPENLYPGDVELARTALSSLSGGVLVQLSTYSANDSNNQKDVIASLNKILLMESGFTAPVAVKANGNMMSLVYTRGIEWSDELADLPDRFDMWFKQARS